MRIYLCSRFSRAPQMQHVGEGLAGLGHIVTSRWHNGKQATNPGETQEDADARHAREDLDDLDDADVLVIHAEVGDQLNGTRGGRWVEFGYALGHWHRLIVIGPRENVFTQMRDRVESVADVKALFALLGDK